MERAKHMVRVRNAHTAKVCGIAAGAQGEVDANNPGVAAQLKAGLLQPVRDDGIVQPNSDAGTVPASELRAACAEIDRRGTLLEAAHRELVELRAQVEALTAPKPTKASKTDADKADADKAQKAS